MNNLLTTSAILIATTAATTASAQSASGDWYTSVFAGASISSDLGFSESGYHPVPGNYTFEYGIEMETGYILGVTAGKRVMSNVRVEVELSYAKYVAGDFVVSVTSDNLPDYSGSYGDVDGEMETTYLLGNVWYEVEGVSSNTNIQPYIGGGLGGFIVKADGEEADGFAYQLGAGAMIGVGAGAIDVGYRFKGTGEFDMFNETIDPLTSSSFQAAYVVNF